MEEYWFEFRDAGRSFHVLVAFGRGAPAERRDEVLALLDSLHFDPGARGSDQARGPVVGCEPRGDAIRERFEGGLSAVRFPAVRGWHVRVSGRGREAPCLVDRVWWASTTALRDGAFELPPQRTARHAAARWRCDRAAPVRRRLRAVAPALAPEALAPDPARRCAAANERSMFADHSGADTRAVSCAGALTIRLSDVAEFAERSRERRIRLLGPSDPRPAPDGRCRSSLAHRQASDVWFETGTVGRGSFSSKRGMLESVSRACARHSASPGGLAWLEHGRAATPVGSASVASS